ncbi:amino acid adenylation domain-containing protein [Hoyosella rhizosphaerae]|uniref:Non-ribosomal peptide synthase n=1 Tax=Hoyosella rhizosphaerae TaxID=1755582 RepID=A0A916UL03_9ACTN|nr:Pls/PosA family non-ribosomal peptide synthetase [Hoyosella rhizosphaerae]MBN4925332.1 amino acid adenylation domain-containing protein [Hoyosella rhizosphaerae]GGC76151.1 putative non-ribosomal peptide synthase [Hoyosella rhizosphaerae]
MTTGLTTGTSPAQPYGERATQVATDASDALLASHRAPRARTLIDILQATTAAHPNAAALDTGDTIYTYAQLLTEVHKQADALNQHGIGAGSRVGIRISSGTAELYIGILAVLAAGAAYVPVDADDPEDRATLVFSEADVAAIVTDEGFTKRRTHRPMHSTPARPPLTHDDAWIIFTSGSTGVPKGVAVTHSNAAAFVDAEARLFLQHRPLGPGDRVLAGLSVAFDASCEEMWLAWRTGACLVPAPRSIVRSGADLGPWLVSHDITAISTVPTLAALWPSEYLESIRLLIFGGEACPPELVSRLAAPQREVWNTYGPTEATVVACAAPLIPGEPVRIGLPLDGWDLAIIDTDGNPVAPGQSGELVIGGAGIARYLDPEKDRHKYAPLPSLGWQRAYRSGDLVSFDGDGLIFLGRADDQVKIGGRRVELGEIDTLLHNLPGVTAAATAVQTTQAGTPVLVGYLTTSGETFDVAAARTTLSAYLPASLIPRLAVLPDLPTRTSGKVDRAALPWPLATEVDDSRPPLVGMEAWVASVWSDVLGTEVYADADFFELGGSSLTAAQLVSQLRTKFPVLTVADLYAHHKLSDLATYLEALAPTLSTATRHVTPQSRRSQALQIALLAIPFGITGAMWTTWAAIASTLLASFTGAPWLPSVPWPILAFLALTLLTPPGRIAITTVSARLLLRGVTPGQYSRGGSTHLKLWLAERIAEATNVTAVASAPWMSLYARALGANVGKDVSFHTIPPITGLLTVGDGAAIEPETDLTGHWLDGDTLHIGRTVIGAKASIGARSTLLPGTKVGKGAHIDAGSAVTMRVPAGQRWAGSPAAATGRDTHEWPTTPPPRGSRWGMIFGITAIGLALLPGVALIPAMVILVGIISGTESATEILLPLAAWIPAAALLWMATFALLTVIAVRLFAIGLRPGTYPVRSRIGWQAWATERLTDSARTFLFPLYASIITPVWLRLLGAKVGKNVEASTVLLIPKFTTIADGAFLADDTLVAAYELGHGWIRIGPTKIGKRAFLGNSGMASPGRKVPKNGLVAVLSAVPAKAKRGSSWLGSPPVKLRRQAHKGSASKRTFSPTAQLRVLRGIVELGRLVPVMLSFAIAVAILGSLAALLAAAGLWATLALSGAVLALGACVAAISTICAKKVLVGSVIEHDTPLWSSFVWRNELADTFTEVVAAPWCSRLCIGTIVGNVWLRGMGAHIGRGVWCETYWLPEADLVHLGDGSTVNRGSVVQTHLFHDRVMSVGPVMVGKGATLGPHSVVLPAAELGDGSTVGPASLVMRGDVVPASSRWQGNPIAPWH